MNGLQAAADVSASDVSAAFASRMAQMQNELREMQKIEQTLKNEDARSGKALQALQRELENVSRGISSAETRKVRLEKELEQTKEELKGLQEKKEDISKKIYDVTASAEKKKADKLRSLGVDTVVEHSLQNSRSAGSGSSQPAATEEASPIAAPPSTASTSAAQDLLAFGGLADLDFTSTQAPSTDLIGSVDFFSPQASTPAVSSVKPATQGISLDNQGNFVGLGGASASNAPAAPMQAPSIQVPNSGVFNAYGMSVDPGQAAFNTVDPRGMMPNGMMPMPSPSGMMPSPNGMMPSPNGMMPSSTGMMPSSNGMMPSPSSMMPCSMPGGANPSSLASLLPTAPGNTAPGVMQSGGMMPGMGMMPGGPMSGYAMQTASMMPGSMPGMALGSMAVGGCGTAPTGQGPLGAHPRPPAPPPQSGPDANFLSLLGMDAPRS